MPPRAKKRKGAASRKGQGRGRKRGRQAPAGTEQCEAPAGEVVTKPPPCEGQSQAAEESDQQSGEGRERRDLLEEFEKELVDFDAQVQAGRKKLLELGAQQNKMVMEYWTKNIDLMPQELREMPWKAFMETHLPQGYEGILKPNQCTRLQGNRKSDAQNTTVLSPVSNKGLGKEAGNKAQEGTGEKSAPRVEKKLRPIRDGELLVLHSKQGSPLCIVGASKAKFKTSEGDLKTCIVSEVEEGEQKT